LGSSQELHRENRSDVVEISYGGTANRGIFLNLAETRVAPALQVRAMEVPMVKSFRDLQVWQKAMDLADAIYTVTAAFPRNEVFGLASQLRRAAVSIPSNVAEGRAIGGGRFLHHLRIAIGSEAEVQTQIELAARRSYITPEQARRLLDDASEVGRMLHGLLNSLEAARSRARITGMTLLLMAGYSVSLLAN
jgi:four helix bundle protein